MVGKGKDGQYLFRTGREAPGWGGGRGGVGVEDLGQRWGLPQKMHSVGVRKLVLGSAPLLTRREVAQRQAQSREAREGVMAGGPGGGVGGCLPALSDSPLRIWELKARSHGRLLSRGGPGRVLRWAALGAGCLEQSKLGASESSAGRRMMGTRSSPTRAVALSGEGGRSGAGPGARASSPRRPPEGRGRARVLGPPLGHVTRRGQGRRGTGGRGASPGRTDPQAAGKTDRRRGSLAGPGRSRLRAGTRRGRRGEIAGRSRRRRGEPTPGRPESPVCGAGRSARGRAAAASGGGTVRGGVPCSVCTPTGRCSTPPSLPEL